MPMFAAVQPELAEAPQLGLVAAARRPDDGDTRWVQGLSWRPERCIASVGYPPCGDAPESASEHNADLVDGVVFYYPPGFRVTDSCPVSAGGRDQLPQRVRRQVDAVTSFRVARELWTGELSAADPFDVSGFGSAQTVNPFLAAAAVEVIPGVHTPVAALARLEERARDLAAGQQVWLHTTIAAASIAQAGGLFRRVGNLMYSPTDAVVIPDAGYPGTEPGGAAPAADRAWAYATGPVQVRLSPILVPDTQDPAPAVLDRATNRWVIIGERRFAATFDPCVHVAIEIALPAAVA